MIRFIACLLLGAVSLGLIGPKAAAEDCGFPPDVTPFIPDGLTASRDEMNLGTRAIRAYAGVVNTYLDCLDTGRDATFLNMNQEQQERWTQDYNAVVERLGEFEESINEEIRKFNARDNS